MDWTAIGAIAAVLSLPLAYHLGTRRHSARIYAEPTSDTHCRITIENTSETPVVLSKVTVLLPLSMKIGFSQYGSAASNWTERPKLPTEWKRSLTTSTSVAPGKTDHLDFELRSITRSCLMLLTVDESRPMQINKMRVIKVLHMPATDNQRPSIFFIG